MERKYKAFISYRHADLDSAVAKSLHSLIEQYKIPKSLRVNGEKKMGIVFRDEEELSATNDLTDKIYTALDNSEHLVVICTKATLQSPWVTKEVEHFLKNHDRDKAHIILADGEPMEVFPRPLTHKELDNGMVEVTEPMAVDIRAEDTPAVKKKLKTQVLRLFAAMLGCPYDALAMREQHRKRQRFAAVMSAVLAVAIGFSTVLLVKNHQIDKKNAELDSANIALEAKNEELDKKNSELDKKNEELEEKNAEVLIRESELLTSNSEKAFREGDNYNAIANAALALPTKTESRPYYAPAESALLTALSPFDGEDNYIMRDTVLKQNTPVENFRISADGTKLATIDLYSVITIFDTVTGEVLNTVQLNTNTVYLSFTHIHLMYCPQADCVIAFDGTTIAAISFETCDILWTHSTPRAQSDFICPSSDGSTFAYMSSVYSEDTGTTDYELVFISGETGEVVGRSTFINSALFSKDNIKSTYFKGFVATGMYNGRFSADNSKFITTFFSKDENEVYTLHYSLTDIAAGTSKTVCSFKVDGYYSSHWAYFLFFDTDDTIISVRSTAKSGYVMTAERISLKTGKKLWQTDLPKAALTVNIDDDDSIFCFTAGPTGATAYTIFGDAVYSFNTETGELYSTNKIPGKVVDADVPNGNFVYVLEDGHYSSAILSTYGISDVGDAIDLGDTLRMRVWNGGPTELNGSDSTENAGYLATIPADDPRSVIIKRISPIEELIPYKETGLGDTGYFSANYPLKLADGSLATGPFYIDGAYFFRIMNPDTGEFIKDFPVSTSFGAENMLFLPDGSGILYTDYYGDVTLYKEDGTSEMLSDTDYLFLSFNDTVICEIPALSASAVLSETGNVLTAVITEDTLSLWTNAADKKEIPIPEDLKWLYFDGHSVVYFMEISSDGSIFVSDFTNDDVFVDRFAVYSTVSGKWSYITLNDTSLSAGLLCFSDSSSNFAVLDENGTVSLYDMAGKMYSRFSLNLPANSIYQMELILDDAYVFIKTTDLQVLIFDAATGETVYQETDVSNASTLLQVYHDSTNNRLYVTTASTSVSCAGLCIDTTSWTTLARINGLIYFNEDTLEMHRVAYKKGTYQTDIIFQALPPVTTLTELARDFLGI